MPTIREASQHGNENSVKSGWSPPITRKRTTKSKFFRTLIKYAKLYCQYSSLVGFKYIVKDGTTWVERILWILVYAITMPTVIFIIRGAYMEFMKSPIITTVDVEYYPTNELEFPGVAICTINRISRRAAMEMAAEIFRANISELNMSEIIEAFADLGNLYDSAFSSRSEDPKIQQLLSKFYGESYDVTEILKRLTPQCSVMLLKCSFHGKKRNCSDIFEFRKTQDGFCCTFNYAIKTDDTFKTEKSAEPIEVYRVSDLGVDRGLSIVMEPFLEDYMFTMLPITGWKVTVFNPRDYPDMTSGGVTEILVSPNRETNVEMDAVMLYSLRNIISYPVTQRGCIFSDEMETFRESYTYSDCIVDCKVEDIWKICNCRPFYYPRRDIRRTCNIEDVACLSKYKSKWYSVVPHEEHKLSNTIVNKSWSLECHNCYPACSDLSYTVKTSIGVIKPGITKSNLLNDIKLENQSIVHVYFTNLGAMTLKQDVLYRWYEIMSDSSGICGVFVGFSIISVVEFIYFTALFLLELWKGPNADENVNKMKTVYVRPSIQAIYWSELFPRTRLGMVARWRMRNDDY